MSPTERKEGTPYLVIAKEMWPEGTASSSGPTTMHFFTFAPNEGEAVTQVRVYLNDKEDQRAEQWHSLNSPDKPYEPPPAHTNYQFTVKYAPESQSTPGSRIFSL